MADSSKDITLDQYIAGQCTRGEVKTPFATSRDMDQMKAMLRDASPDTVLKVAGAWKQLSDTLATGDASIKATFDQAVAHIMQHWEGEAAQGFQAKAQTISKSIQDTATYAEYTSIAMKSAGTVLDQIKPQVMAMEKPSGLASAWDYATDLGDRSDAYKNDLDKTDSGGAQNALDKDSGSLSAGKEAQLQMAAKMETLAVTYTSQAATMGTWKKTPIREEENYPGDPGGTAPIPVVIPHSMTVSSTRPISASADRSGNSKTEFGSSKAVTAPREAGISGGTQAGPAEKPQISTSVDGISGGLSNASRLGEGFTSTGAGGALGAVGGGAGSSSDMVAGLPAAGGAGLGATGAPGAKFGEVIGRGMPGVSKAFSGSNAESTRSGGVARMRGGIVGEAEEPVAGSRSAQGGSGLHQSRGAAGKGKPYNGRKGMMASRGADTSREEEEARSGQRPDYLVEDEETWVPDCDVTPRVIE